MRNRSVTVQIMQIGKHHAATVSGEEAWNETRQSESEF